MAASFRNVGEIQELAGCACLPIIPIILACLALTVHHQQEVRDLCMNPIQGYCTPHNCWHSISPCSRRCDNITISPALLGELDKSTDPLPRKLWPEMGGCDEPKARTKTSAC